MIAALRHHPRNFLMHRVAVEAETHEWSRTENTSVRCSVV